MNLPILSSFAKYLVVFVDSFRLQTHRMWACPSSELTVELEAQLHAPLLCAPAVHQFGA